MKVQEVILRAMAKRITWWQAAEIVGISDRWMRRWRERYQEFGYDGLFDKRRGKASPRRVPMALAEQVLQFYREKYFDLNVLHFHQKLVEEHGIRLSYTWVKLALPGAGLVARERKRGVHRKRRQRRPPLDEPPGGDHQPGRVVGEAGQGVGRLGRHQRQVALRRPRHPPEPLDRMHHS